MLCIDDLQSNHIIILQGTGIDGEIGHVVCRGLSLNCHGLTDMLVGERVEYAWLMQLDLQKITASFSTAQVFQPLILYYL